MKITVLGEVYNVSEPVGRKFSRLMADGVDELVAAREALSDPTDRARPAEVAPVQTIQPIIHIHMSDTKAEAPSVQVDVHVPEQPAAVVNVAQPALTIEPPIVNVHVPEPVPMRTVVDYAPDGTVLGDHQEAL